MFSILLFGEGIKLKLQQPFSQSVSLESQKSATNFFESFSVPLRFSISLNPTFLCFGRETFYKQNGFLIPSRLQTHFSPHPLDFINNWALHCFFLKKYRNGPCFIEWFLSNLCITKILMSVWSYVNFSWVKRCITGQPFLNYCTLNALIYRLCPKSETHNSHGIETSHSCGHFSVALL